MPPTKTHLMKINKAERKQSKMKIALQGPSGSGKTFSSLLLAHGLCGSWSKTVVIDTENGSSNLYAHLGEFNVIQITAPYSPEKFIEAIILAERSGMEVIILDSISHEWEGQGGILDVHSSMMGNSFTNWAKLTPRHNGFVQKILSSSCHVIGTIRSKQDYVLTQKNGKHVPEKVGLKGVTRENMDYEFTVVLDLNIKHNAVASKDRTQLFMDQPSFIVTQSTGRLIKNWCEEGLDPLILVQPIPETNQHKPLDSDEVNDTILFNRKMNSADSHHHQLNENFKFSENGNS